MVRRRFADDPTSRLAIWARRCAFFSLAATVLSILIVRSGVLEIEPALATFAGALVFAVIGIVLAFGAFIEAGARTPIMGFREDIAVRIRRDDDGAKIDVRSASRFGRHDFGSNAARIRSLLEDIDDRLTADNEKAERAAQRQLQQQQ